MAVSPRSAREIRTSAPAAAVVSPRRGSGERRRRRSRSVRRIALARGRGRRGRSTRPTQLAPGTFDGAKLLDEAVDYGGDLSQVTDEGLHELVSRRLDDTRRRALLSRIAHSPQPELVALVADDLAAYNTTFGAVRVHDELTLDQLHALAARAKTLEDRSRVDRGGHPADAAAAHHRSRARSRGAREVPRELWAFVARLPPASNSLKAHVLWHLLDTHRRRDGCRSCRSCSRTLRCRAARAYVPYKRIENLPHEQLAQIGADFRAVTGLPPAGDDEALVRDLLQRRISRMRRPARAAARARVARGRGRGGTAALRHRRRRARDARARPGARRRAARPRRGSRGVSTTRCGSRPTSPSCSTPT